MQHFVRLLQPLEVVNPFAHRLQLPEEADNLRRLNRLFNAFVKQIAVLHQQQRGRDEKGRIIADVQDVKTAIDVMFDSIVLKVDELDGALRDFYEKIKRYVQDKGMDYEFTQREVRQAFFMSQSQVQRHMEALMQLEYISKTHVGKRGTFQYRIQYWDSLQQLRQRVRNHLYRQLEAITNPQSADVEATADTIPQKEVSENTVLSKKELTHSVGS